MRIGETSEVRLDADRRDEIEEFDPRFASLVFERVEQRTELRLIVSAEAYPGALDRDVELAAELTREIAGHRAFAANLVVACAVEEAKSLAVRERQVA